MNLHERIPGRFVIRQPGNKAYSPLVARDIEAFTAGIEAALDRPFDRFDPDTGEVWVDGQVVLTIEFAGTLTEPVVDGPAAKAPRLSRCKIPKAPLKRASFMKAVKLSRVRPSKSKQIGKSPRDRARMRRVRKSKP